ncbi:MAG: SAM-dependent methyltransferase [Lachnospiraceae bacterium]|nr:SAM-dependent methyltransferase [Lachnospiraceae bacterium]
MVDSEQRWDRLLRIKTGGRDDSHAGAFNFPYEPTPYCVLERLASRGYIGKRNTLVDYGCGKGRVPLFMSYQTRCRSYGVEYDEDIYNRALRNVRECPAGNRVNIMLTKADTFEVPVEADRFYFFNPFSVEILKRVLKRIMETHYVNLTKLAAAPTLSAAASQVNTAAAAVPTDRLLFFYYPSQEYISALQAMDELTLVEDIDCTDLCPDTANERERVVVFGISETIQVNAAGKPAF